MPPFVDPGFVDSGFVEGERSLVELLSDPEARINVAIEITSTRISDGVAKTWYVARFIDHLLRDAHPDFLQILSSVGPFSQVMAQDMLVGAVTDGVAVSTPTPVSVLGGLIQGSAGTIVLSQDRPDVDILSQFSDYTFAGGTITVKIGELFVDSYAVYHLYATATIDQEPTPAITDTGFSLTFELATVSSRLLSQQMQITRNVGIPTCVEFISSLSYADAPFIVQYETFRYSLVARFQISSIPSSRITITQARTDFVAADWWHLYLDIDGKIYADTNGSFQSYLISSPVLSFDLPSHTIAFSIDNDVTAYLIVDGVVVGTTIPVLGLADLGSPTTVEMARRSSGTDSFKLLDCRIYDRYYQPTELLGLISTRIEGNELSVVAAWRFDDNEDLSTAVTDYSSFANHATLHGTVNVNYFWRPSDLGDPQLSGVPESFIFGSPFNAKAQLIDGFRSRFRVADTDIVDEISGQSIALRSRGDDLAAIADYTDAGNGVYQMVDPQPEPVTFDINGGGSRNYVSLLPTTLITRSPLASSDIDADRLTSLSFLCPWEMGFVATSDLNVASFLSQLMGSAGFSYYEDEQARLFVDFLLPPIGLNPYGEPCLDFRGRPNAHITFGNIASVSSSHVVACWFYTQATDTSAIASDILQTPPIGQFLIDKGNNYCLSIDLVGGGAGRLLFSHLTGPSIGSLYAPAGIIDAGNWYFAAGVLNNAAKTRSIYLGKQGSTLSLVASDAGWTGSPTPNTNHLAIGGATPSGSDGSYTFGSVAYAQVWSGTKTIAQLQALMDGSNDLIGNESGLLALVPVNEGMNSSVSVDLVSGQTGSVSLASWAPALTINLNNQARSVKLVDGPRRLIPASKIVIKYRRNWSPQVAADIATGVDPSIANDYKKVWNEVEVPVPTTSAKSRTIILETALVNRDDALRLGRFIAYRFSSDRYIMTLEFKQVDGESLARRALALKMGDEVIVTSSFPTQFAAGRSMRVVGLTRDPINISVRAVLWG